MLTYLGLMLTGSIVVFALYGLYCARAAHLPTLRERAWLTAGLSFVLAAVFGTVLARISYALLMQELDFEYDGIEALWYLLEFDIDNVSFFGGAVGVVLGVWLANRLTRRNAVAVAMDAFAPFGALLVALFRLGEGFFGSYGTGANLPEGSSFAFFPFALEIKVDGGYSYWGWAIFALSAAFALIWAAADFFFLRKNGRTGMRFSLAAFFLALTQVLCESMRKRGMLWLFVHTEQVLCMVVVVAVMLFWILRSQASGVKRFLPLIVTGVCIGLLVATEFAIDGKLFDLSHTVCYSFMCAVLAVIGVSGAVAVRRWSIQK